MGGARFVAAALAVFASAPAAADVFPLESGDDQVVGEIETVVSSYEDTLLDIGRRHGLGYEEITRANPDVDPWLPGEGTEVVLPRRFVLPDAPREGIVINLPELRLYYYPPPDASGGRRVVTHPISIGRMDWATPLGASKVVSKVTDPAWYPPESVREEHAKDGRTLPRVVPPGPDNPLGRHAMRLSIPGYLIHGTNRPAGVGMRVTHGCVRMYPEDIAALFDDIPIGTPVRIVDQPYKLGWDRGSLYLESHPPLDENAEDFRERGLTVLTELLVAATASRTAEFDWRGAERVASDARGLPVRVGADAGPREPDELVAMQEHAAP